MRNIIIFIFLLPSICFSQSIIWERDYLLPDPIGISLLPTIIDSDGNIVSLVDISTDPFTNSYFFKYDINGNLLSFKTYNYGKVLIPVALFQAYNSYNILGATNNKFDKINSFSLPFILNADKTGDTNNIDFPYDIYDDNLYETVSFIVNNGNNNTISKFNKFFNVSRKQNIKINNNTYSQKNHILISNYDTNGLLSWRKSTDTLEFGIDYLFSDLKFTKQNNLLILTNKYNNLNKTSKFQIMEIDTTGTINKNIEFKYDKMYFFPKGIEELESGKYAILGQDTSNNNINHIILILNDSGIVINKKYIPRKHYYQDFDEIIKTPKGNLIVTGITFINPDSSQNWDICYNYFYQFNKNLDFVSDFEFCEHTYQNVSGIRHLHFLDDNNFIGIGYKDRYKFYIAKFSDSSTTDINDAIKQENEMFTYPNPANEFVSIFLPVPFTNSTNMKFYNSVGNEIRNIHYRLSLSDKSNKIDLDVSSLCNGFYFLVLHENLKSYVGSFIVNR